MKNIIEELYHGNVAPLMWLENNKALYRKRRELKEQYIETVSKLSPEMRKEMDDLMDAQSQLASDEQRLLFFYGYQMAMRFVYDSFL